MTERYFWISLPYATFGVGVTDGVVTSAAPIAGWALGKPAAALAFYRRRGAEIVEITAMIAALQRDTARDMTSSIEWLESQDRD